MAGEILIEKVETSGAGPGPIPVPGGMIHHRRGAAFFPEVTLQALLAGVTNPAGDAIRQEDVLESRILERGPDSYLQAARAVVGSMRVKATRLPTATDSKRVAIVACGEWIESAEAASGSTKIQSPRRTHRAALRRCAAGSGG